MYRYFALVWDADDASASSCAWQLGALLERSQPLWQDSSHYPGLRVWDLNAHPKRNHAHVFPGAAGLALGKLFEKRFEPTTPPRPASPSEHDVARIIATGGQHLLDHFWGRYVAFIRDPQSNVVRVLRDPSGCLPCYFTTHRGVTLFFSDIEDCLALRALSFSINWKYIAACSALVDLKISATGLNEVTELMQGEAADARGGGVTVSQCWDPVRMATEHPIEDPQQAIAEAAATVKGCIRAWAGCYDSALVALSGGLDSSIVFRTLARGAPEVRLTGFNNYVEVGSSADERRFARLAAEGTSGSLRERLIDIPSIPLQQILNIARTPKPAFVVYDILHGAFEAQLASETGAGGSFMGSGGDHVFMQDCARNMVGDFIRTRGWRPRLLRVAADAATITRQSAWLLIRKGTGEARRAVRWEPHGARFMNQFISQDALRALLNDVEYATPRALRTAAGLPLGKLRHIEMILTTHPFYWAQPHAHSPERLAPFFSQPVAELTLRLPTYVLGWGGWDRAIERAAFEKDVPTQIIRRRSKGNSDNLSRQLTESNIGFIRELLLDGMLAREGILDRGKLEAFFCGPRIGARKEYGEIYTTRLSVEAWLHRWRDPRSRAAA